MPDLTAVRETLARIEQLWAMGLAQAAEQECRELTRIAPQEVKGWLYSGLLALQSRRLEEAEAAFQEVVALEPNNAGYWHNLAVAFREQNKVAQAETCARRSVDLDAANPAAWLNLGNALFGQSRWDEAIAAYRRSLALDPNNPVPWSNLGTAAQRQARYSEAREAYERSLALAPDDPIALTNYGHVLAMSGEAQRAKELLLKVVRQYRSAVAWAALGTAHRHLGEDRAAELAFREALACDERYTPALYQLALLLELTWGLPDAEALLERLLALEPQNADAWMRLGAVKLLHAQADDAMAALRRGCDLSPDADRQSVLIASLHYLPESEPLALLEAHRQWDAQFARPLTAAAPPHAPRRSDGPLRIGFVSCDFGLHPTGFLALPALVNLDRSACSVICYNDRPDEDEYTGRFQAVADVWRSVYGQSHEELAEQIRADQVDILFDLMGHTRRRLLTFARRPAPVQITWLGYVGTTGMTAMDFLLADRFHVRPGEEAYHVERILRMPHGYACYGPLADAPEVGPLPALAAGHVTFGCFNNPAKYSRPVFDVFAEVLRRVPTARLLLKFGGLDKPQVQERIGARFRERGIAPERIVMEGWTPLRDSLARYGHVDIALDTQPYSGGLTTCEALWMGVPVVTYPGRTFAGRHAQSHLTNAGCEPFVAADAAGYVELATAWAGRLDELAELRGRLREQVRRSPLCDAPAFARDLLALLQQAWRSPADNSSQREQG